MDDTRLVLKYYFPTQMSTYVIKSFNSLIYFIGVVIQSYNFILTIQGYKISVQEFNKAY